MLLFRASYETAREIVRRVIVESTGIDPNPKMISMEDDRFNISLWRRKPVHFVLNLHESPDVWETGRGLGFGVPHHLLRFRPWAKRYRLFIDLVEGLDVEVIAYTSMLEDNKQNIKFLESSNINVPMCRYTDHDDEMQKLLDKRTSKGKQDGKEHNDD